MIGIVFRVQSTRNLDYVMYVDGVIECGTSATHCCNEMEYNNHNDAALRPVGYWTTTHDDTWYLWYDEF